jgi:hypothetical protein
MTHSLISPPPPRDRRNPAKSLKGVMDILKHKFYCLAIICYRKDKKSKPLSSLTQLKFLFTFLCLLPYFFASYAALLTVTFDDLIAPKPEEGSFHTHGTKDKALTLDEVMFQHIRRVLETTKGKLHGKGGAVEVLGMNPALLETE